MAIGLILLVVELLIHQGEAMTVKNYSKKYGSGGMFFNAIICLFAMIYFVVSDKGKFEFPPTILYYGLINAVAYAIGFYAAFAAFRSGSFGLTRLFTSFGCLITITYGIVFLKETPARFMWPAVALIIISIILMNYQKKESDIKISFKWIFWVLMIVISNAAAGIMGIEQFGLYGDAYNNEFLAISLAGATLYLFIMGFILERDKFRTTFKTGFAYGAFAGVLNGVKNLIALAILNYLDVSFLSPLKTAIGIALTFLVSAVIYKEKFTRRQLAGVLIGIVAIVLINIK